MRQNAVWDKAGNRDRRAWDLRMQACSAPCGALEREHAVQLLGAMVGPEPIAAAVASAIRDGWSAARAAQQAQTAVERLDASLD